MSDADAKQILAELAEIKALLVPTVKATDVFTKKEAAIYLRVSDRTFHRLTKVGTIKKAYPTGPLRFRKSDLDTYKVTGASSIQYGVKRRKST